MANQYDIVYILKSDAPVDERRYSLRAVEENMPHRKVWFYCGKPDGLEPDEHVPMIQTGSSKWAKARSSLIAVCKNKDITKKFWLFNDDFYVLKPCKSTKPFHRGVIKDHVINIEKKRGGRSSNYSNQLRACEDYLHRAGLTTLDYALHIPMLVDREKMLEALECFPNCPMFRSLYGNYANIGGTFHKDVKVSDPAREINPDLDFLSSNDKSFQGELGKFLAERFPAPSRFEVD